MEIRLANLRDLKACFEIDDSFDTEYVWQMDEQSHGGTITASFHLTRLPRPMRVSDIVPSDELADDVRRGATLFVADEGGVRGFLAVTAQTWNQVAYINKLAVAAPFRRRGVATRLMRAALDWARPQKLRAAMLDTSTKDYPAICFYQKHGFSFCGFNDQLYPNRDIALYFSLSLR